MRVPVPWVMTRATCGLPTQLPTPRRVRRQYRDGGCPVSTPWGPAFARPLPASHTRTPNHKLHFHYFLINFILYYK